MNRKNLAILLIAHILPIVIFVIQSTYIADSFRSDLPLLFYIVAAVAGLGFSLTSSAWVSRALTKNFTPDCTIKVLPFCSVCKIYQFPRTFHCPKCGFCSDHQIGHLESTDACLGQYQLSFVLAGVGLTMLYFTYVLVEIGLSLFSFESSLSYLYGRFLLLIIAVPYAWLWVQFSIVGIQLVQIVLTNSIILESYRVKGFEVFRIQKRSRNPYDVGIVANAMEIADPVRQGIWPGLRPGPVTDAFCEDMLRYRGVDLRPTIVVPDAAAPPQPE
jgi:hypothetical protein